ncbi:transcriptional repressor Rok [Bacillus velezensis]|uniref:Rok-like winged helix domain-containing protein n=1 Tax=Bacillus velezensis TaxID=492670 RepID=UPI001E540687|nr:transcriptional repressor Rok [Bacillus velezensis]MCD7911094.1 transcriptional repressor Rok [Bacillus velezensis]
MFTEREALRLRLEQLNGAELKIMREIQSERNRIYMKLCELDKQNHNPYVNSKKSLLELAYSTAQALKTENEKNAKNALVSSRLKKFSASKIAPGSKTAIQREATLEILKGHKNVISGSDLKSKIQRQTGLPINNMTIFMQGLMKQHREVKKISRGLYLLEQNSDIEKKPF